ncbi:hypothetical protein D4764_11G0009840 [Takifugu flavidus]|uniref:Uncharacterized protein n=1 Tax=Takifugu flavidus TaxID=433684 RepID=A0A5C6PH80_9TELE|nr:hypothetical protein D4764_11G0009840 [Takifugu flavidus]
MLRWELSSNYPIIPEDSSVCVCAGRSLGKHLDPRGERQEQEVKGGGECFFFEEGGAFLPLSEMSLDGISQALCLLHEAPSCRFFSFCVNMSGCSLSVLCSLGLQQLPDRDGGQDPCSSSTAD